MPGIVRDDPPSRLWRYGGQARLIRLVRRSSRERAKAEPRTDKIDGRPQGAPSTGFPVAIGAESHPFPFRTRKLSLLPPMVLRAQVRGRVGHCRGYISPRSITPWALFLYGRDARCWNAARRSSDRASPDGHADEGATGDPGTPQGVPATNTDLNHYPSGSSYFRWSSSLDTSAGCQCRLAGSNVKPVKHLQRAASCGSPLASRLRLKSTPVEPRHCPF